MNGHHQHNGSGGGAVDGGGMSFDSRRSSWAEEGDVGDTTTLLDARREDATMHDSKRYAETHSGSLITRRLVDVRQEGHEPQPPDDPDFHTHEYSVACPRCDAVDVVKENGWLQLAFLVIGSGPLWAYSVTYVCVAFFQAKLGTEVLSLLGIMQNAPSLTGQLLYNGLRQYLPYKRTIFVCVGFQLIYTISIPLMELFITGGPPKPLLFAFILLGGATSGVGLASVGAVGGLFLGGTADSRLITGGGLAHLVPTVMQIVLLYRSLGDHTDAQVREINRSNLFIVFPMGILGSMASLVALFYITSTTTFKTRSLKEIQRYKDVATPEGKVVAKRKTKGRLRWVAKHIYGVWITLGVSVYLIAISPSVPNVQPESAFWTGQLVTIIVAAYNTGDAFGRAVAGRKLPAWMTRCYNRSPIWLQVLVTLRVGLIVLVILFIWRPFVHSNIFMVAVFLVMSISNGYFAVKQSFLAQQSCGFNDKHQCPIVGALMQTAISAGIIVGTVLSFVPIRF